MSASFGRLSLSASSSRVAGLPRVTIRVRPTSDYGKPIEDRSLGSNHITFQGKDLAIRLTTDGPLSSIERETAFVLTKPIHMVLGPDEPLEGDIVTICREFADRTRDYWMEWVRRLSIAYEWQDAIIRAAITLKLSNFEETGGIVAALTTSIPEAPGIGTDMGLPILLAARCLFRGEGAQSPGRDQDDGRLHLLHSRHRFGRIRCGRSTASYPPIPWTR